MPNSKMCPTVDCETEVQPQVDNGTVTWDCPNCDWKLEITINENG